MSMTRRRSKKAHKRAPPKNRTRYEGELVKLIGTARRDCYVSPSGNTQGWDVFVVHRYGKKFVPIEVKTSSTTKNINLAYNPRVKKQYEKYDNIWQKHKIATWYAFRQVTRGPQRKESKWRFVPINNINQMLLAYDDGLPLNKFVEVIL